MGLKVALFGTNFQKMMPCGFLVAVAGFQLKLTGVIKWWFVNGRQEDETYWS
jgi:hypothetical protein